MKLPNAKRKESMGICFVGNVKLREFLAQRVPVKPGEIFDTTGNKVGDHRGVQSYTLGQRDGLNIGGTGPYYVVGKDLKTNTLTVSKNTDDPLLMSTELRVEGVNWIAKPPKFPFKCRARFRHQQEMQSVLVSPRHADGSHLVTFSRAQRAVAPGQSIVFYTGTACLGGGVIV